MEITNNGNQLTIDYNRNIYVQDTSQVTFKPEYPRLTIYFDNKDLLHITDLFENITINGVQLTSSNYNTLLGTLASSEIVLINDSNKTEVVATDATSSWTWGNLFRGILQNVKDIFTKLNGTINVNIVSQTLGNVLTPFGTTPISTTQTSPTISTIGYNAVLIQCVITGTSIWSVSLIGGLQTTDIASSIIIIDNNGNQLTTGNISVNTTKLMGAVPNYIAVIATLVSGTGTILVKVQPINV